MATRLSKADTCQWQVARFWLNCKKVGQCWEWQLSTNAGGYGQYNAGSAIVAAHRYAYYVVKGEDPGDKLVCHSCDNRKCVNPEHLFIGDHKDNNRDMFWKGRGFRFDGSLCRGTRNVHAKLTPDQVIEIRRMRREGVPLLEISQKFGVTKTNIIDIGKGKTWKWLADDGTDLYAERTEEQVAAQRIGA